MDAIRDDITAGMTSNGYHRVEIRTVLRPAWTTDWISDRGRERLREFGIAPPRPVSEQGLLQLTAECPRCGSRRTRLISPFGSTACKAHWVCGACGEPFDKFKEH